MGTYYSIEVIDVPIELKIKNIELEIKDTLKKANKILSNWDKDSEISIINKTNKTTAIKISDELNEVFKTAKEITAIKKQVFWAATKVFSKSTPAHALRRCFCKKQPGCSGS